ncbi:MAG: HAD hydrolase family protein [Crocinitomicaceae bacterium]|jgi:3-deoxy-D-manno-octulosonate 8-phosphate phosphatase (KDO 8-P phosphatase)|nr:HAD hydrolase family protein [Crocinitomicaceae bacterium]
MTSYKEKLNKITTFIFDVDGVLTNGNVILFNNEMVRTFNSRDAYAIQYASKMGYEIFIITGGNSTQVKERLTELGCREVVLSSSTKLDSYTRLKSMYEFSDEEVLYMGDDIPDYEVMSQVGLATCPQDAVIEIKSICHYQSPYNGGDKCVRDVIEQTLRVQGKWFTQEAFTW